MAAADAAVRSAIIQDTHMYCFKRAEQLYNYLHAFYVWLRTNHSLREQTCRAGQKPPYGEVRICSENNRWCEAAAVVVVLCVFGKVKRPY